MEQVKCLNRKALEKRITKTSTTKEALRDVTPFTIESSQSKTKIIVKKDTKHV